MNTSPHPFFPQLAQIADFKTRLLKFPEALYQARLAHADAEMAAAAVREQLKQTESETVLFVQGERTGDGKAAFTNEATRAAEVRRRLGESRVHRDLARLLGEAEASCTRLEMEVRRLEDEQRAVRAHADLLIAETQLLVAGR